MSNSINTDNTQAKIVFLSLILTKSLWWVNSYIRFLEKFVVSQQLYQIFLASSVWMNPLHVTFVSDQSRKLNTLISGQPRQKS